ncbi:MAG TPA: GNAT family N-acetyltransferase [Anaerolineales bacterium]|nr:GNAT family N-acetyltransferase [Anaerolineales bacterium]HNN12933.1 GNAT family N-acetyltransferase [Anaerolineales bacterium]
MKWRILPELELTPALEASIQQMLIAAFPDYEDFFSTHSYWGSTPEFRLIALENDTPVAHLEFGYRTITVNEMPFMIAGIGAVAIHPSHQGRKLGKVMFFHLREHLLQNTRVDFGFIGCHDEVVGFYKAAGFTRVHQSVYNLNPDSLTWETFHGPTLILPIHRSLDQWKDGLIHLHGMPW